MWSGYELICAAIEVYDTNLQLTEEEPKVPIFLEDFHRKKRSEEEVEYVRDLSLKRKRKKYRKKINVTVPKRSFNKILIKKKRKKKR